MSNYKNRGKKNSAIMPINIGQMVEQKIAEQKIFKSTLARNTGRRVSGIAPFLKRPSMQVYVLWELSEALGHNFFHHIADVLDEKNGFTLSGKNTKDSEELKKEIEKLKTENGILREVINLKI